RKADASSVTCVLCILSGGGMPFLARLRLVVFASIPCCHSSGGAMGETPDQPELLSAPIMPVRQCGLDEVGRGALAGPLVAAAVTAPEDIVERLGPLARFLRDSKTVPAARRREITVALRQSVVTYEIVTIPTEQINERGIGWANREAFRLLITLIAAREDVDEYVLDGKVRPPRPDSVAAVIRCLPKADALVPAVSAA